MKLALAGICAALLALTLGASGASAATCPAANHDPYSQAVLADSPLVFYRLDENSGPTMCDSSVSANDGAYGASGLTYGVPGPLASGVTAIAADGSADTVGTSDADPAGLTGNHAFTLEAWFKSATTTPPNDGNAWLVGIGSSGSTGQADVLSLDPNHESQLGWGPSSAISLDQYGSDFAWNPSSVGVNPWDGSWHYLAVTYSPSGASNDSSASQYTGYIDGHDLGSPDARPYGNAVTDIAASPVLLGNGCATSGCYWLPLDGDLAEVAVYGTALSPTRISAHYAAASETTPKPVKPVEKAAPAITGHLVAADTLEALPGSWSGTAPITFAYQWQLCGSTCGSIPGATGRTLALSPAMVGKHVRVIVRASNSAGSSYAVSGETWFVQPSASSVTAALGKVLIPDGKAAAIGALRKSGGYRFSFSASGPGRLVIVWSVKRAGRTTVVASGTGSYTAAGREGITVKLTKAGKSLLKHAKRLRLSAAASFTPLGGSRVSRGASFTVRRAPR